MRRRVGVDRHAGTDRPTVPDGEPPPTARSSPPSHPEIVGLIGRDARLRPTAGTGSRTLRRADGARAGRLGRAHRGSSRRADREGRGRLDLDGSLTDQGDTPEARRRFPTRRRRSRTTSRVVRREHFSALVEDSRHSTRSRRVSAVTARRRPPTAPDDPGQERPELSGDRERTRPTRVEASRSPQNAWAHVYGSVVDD